MKTQEEIIEGNKLIAEFMGMKHLSTTFDSYGYEQYSYSMTDELSKQVYGYTGATCFLEDQFSKSWDWLMPVVEKIEQGLFYVKIRENRCVISGYRKYSYMVFLVQEGDKDKIQATYECVIQFIQWYNQQLKQ